MNMVKIILEGLTLVKAAVWKAWSKVCQIIVRRANELSLLRWYSMSIFFVGLGKMFWTAWPIA